MASRSEDNDIVRVDFAFKRELAKKVEGNLANFCYQCGACVGDCPATRYSEEFNPREIMLKVLYGLETELLGEGNVLWQCTNFSQNRIYHPRHARKVFVLAHYCYGAIPVGGGR